jgi:carboxyl-terminal processing protease
MISMRIAAACFAVLLLAAPPARAATESRPPAESSSETYRYLKLFGDVFERVRADYVEKVGDKELIEAAIRGMLTSLDPHSSYLDAKSFSEMQVQTKGEFGGLGIEVTLENGWVKVVSPIDDTPAFRAGIQPGDVIAALDGESTQNMTLAEAVDKMRGKVKTDIKLTIRRGEQPPFDVKITRDIIKIQAVRSSTEKDVGILRISAFNETTMQAVEAAVTKLRGELGKNMKGVVLDLRNNPGGLLDQAISVSDAFLTKGAIVSTRGRKSDEATIYNARPGDILNGLPIVVLINDGSASASEIVAGALQDHRRAIVLGTKSFGKGSVQTISPIPGHGALRITTARYYTPSGRSIQQRGIDPDIVVEAAKAEGAEKRAERHEADLRRSLKNDGKTEQSPTPPPANLPKLSGPGTEYKDSKGVVDLQMGKALDVLRGMSVSSTQSVN